MGGSAFCHVFAAVFYGLGVVVAGHCAFENGVVRGSFSACHDVDVTETWVYVFCGFFGFDVGFRSID